MSHQMTHVLLCTVLMTPFFSESLVHFHDRHIKKLAPPFSDDKGKQATTLAQQRMVSLVAGTILCIQANDCVAFEYNCSESCCITYRIVKASEGTTIAVTPSPTPEDYMGKGCPSDFRYSLTVNLCFKIITYEDSWEQARRLCSKYGQDGRLLILDENRKFAAVRKYLMKSKGIRLGVHLGGRCKSGRCTWTNGKDVNEAFLQRGQPDRSGECLNLCKTFKYHLDDVNCRVRQNSVCEVPMK